MLFMIQIMCSKGLIGKVKPQISLLTVIYERVLEELGAAHTQIGSWKDSVQTAPSTTAA